MNRPKVYITNDTGLSFDRAFRFGVLVHMSVGPIDVFNPEEVKAGLAACLEHFDYERDFLLCSGAALTAGFSLVALAKRGAPHVQLLVYDSKKRDYFVRTVSL